MAAKIAIVGSGGVGKTACSMRYLRDKFIEEYNPTVEDSYKKTVVVDGHEVDLEIVDTAGQEDFTLFRQATMGYVDGFVIVYAINSAKSFAEIEALHTEVASFHRPIALLGNKTDTTDRQVSTADGEAFARNHNIDFFYECSAKKGPEFINRAFEQVISKILTSQVSIPEDKKCCCIL